MPDRKRRWHDKKHLGSMRRLTRGPADDTISLRTLRMIDQSVANMRRGIVGDPIDPELIERLAR